MIKAQNEAVSRAVTGNRIRKNEQQMNILLTEFEKDPKKWTVAKAYEIGCKIGEATGKAMVHSAVTKWNWDHRKKLGLCTSRREG